MLTMQLGKFKVGDTIKCIETLPGGPTIGGIYTIVPANLDDCYLKIKLEDKSDWFLYGDYLEHFDLTFSASQKIVESSEKEMIDHPSYYGGKDNVYEAIKIIEFFNLGFNLGNLVKYVLRAGKKDPAKHLEDLKKAKWYLEREIYNLDNR